MMPDSDGNTVLHIMALGVIKEKDFDFIKYCVLKYNLRLSLNRENRSPLSIIKKFSARAIGLRGQLNVKRKVWEWFQQRIEMDPTF